MNFKLFTVGMIVILACVTISGYYPLIYYWSALFIITSLLNTRKDYKGYALFANALFFLYITFITWVRTRDYSFAKNTEMWLNNCEHLLFALVICLMVSLFIRTVISASISFSGTLLSTIITFNIIGVINEYFQNIINHRDFFHLTPDSQKDLLINAFGTAVFIMLALLWHFNKTRLQQILTRLA